MYAVYADLNNKIDFTEIDPIVIQTIFKGFSKTFSLAALVLFIAGTSLPAYAQVQTFTDLGTFQSAVNISTIEDFESFEPSNGGAGDTAVADITSATPFDLAGFSIVESPTTRVRSGNTYQTIDTVEDSSRDSFGDVGFGAYLSVGLETAGDNYSFGIDPGFTAIGYDYTSWSNGAHSQLHTFTFADGSTFSVNPAGGADFTSLSTSGFFGLLSNSAVVSLDFEFVSTNSIEGSGFDNFVFGTSAEAVPEPTSASLLALAGLSVLLPRKRRK